MLIGYVEISQTKACKLQQERSTTRDFYNNARKQTSSSSTRPLKLFWWRQRKSQSKHGSVSDYLLWVCGNHSLSVLDFDANDLHLQIVRFPFIAQYNSIRLRFILKTRRHPIHKGLHQKRKRQVFCTFHQYFFM